jgi:hypothetical protein
MALRGARSWKAWRPHPPARLPSVQVRLVPAVTALVSEPVFAIFQHPWAKDSTVLYGKEALPPD